MIQNKTIILGVSGGIAAYKSVELLRLLTGAGATVRVVMTRNAQWFVGPMTFKALSGQPVCTGLFEDDGDASIRHIDWAREADAVIIAPATANIIAKLANGIADDALSTLLLAVTAPVFVCPAMNTHMFDSRPVQLNLERLREMGYTVMAPASGHLACGTTGPGRLPDPALILDRLISGLTPKDFQGKRVLVTAGPTYEAMDPVRFIGNPSSGKMGYAIARAAEQRGAEVTLVSGPSHLPDPLNMATVRVRSAGEMASAVFEYADRMDVIIKAAAVSDYRPIEIAANKIKKDKDELRLTLTKNQDILRALGRMKKKQVLVGFAAETEDLKKNAEKKLIEKNCDIIVANLVGHSHSGFGSDTNQVTLFFKDGRVESLDTMEKESVARILLDRVKERFS
ncbi:MAG: bifunctional phosphopantothenoylcysteine decarboxylase/phosphopantothenate--cysteine ligase CoaBC [Desulfobacterales bacterium]|nr:bifunctional phosphopantothenoylcysteine decarboxylase/phosphopantothenate--cysteine ligase CoaBC [Desulfobacterales bacterium]